MIEKSKNHVYYMLGKSRMSIKNDKSVGVRGGSYDVFFRRMSSVQNHIRWSEKIFFSTNFNGKSETIQMSKTRVFYMYGKLWMCIF